MTVFATKAWNEGPNGATVVANANETLAQRGSGTLQYTSTSPATGNFAGHVTLVAAADYAYIVQSFTAVTGAVWHGFFYRPGAGFVPTGATACYFASMVNGATPVVDIRENSDGTLSIRDRGASTNLQKYTTPSPIPRSTWVWIAYRAIPGSSTGLQLKVYVPNSSGVYPSTATYDSGGVASTSAQTQISEVHSGTTLSMSATTAYAYSYDIDTSIAASTEPAIPATNPVTPPSSGTPPRVTLGADQTVYPNGTATGPTTTFTATATASSPNTISRYTWRLIAGRVSLTPSSSGTTATFVAPVQTLDTNVQVGVIVTDSAGLASTEAIGNAYVVAQTEWHWSGTALVPVKTVNATATVSGTTAPPQVTGLTAGASGTTTQALSWTAAARATDYIIEFKRTSSSTWTTFADGTSTTTSTTVTGLTGGVSYDYRVSATNSGGTGPVSTTLTVSTSSAANIMSYGAYADGVHDDAPALRAALAANLSVYIPAGNYLLNSYESPRQTRLSADFIASLRTGTSITADAGATLKFGNGVISGSSAAWGGQLFMIDTKTDVSITGGTWDMNGANNLRSSSQDTTGYAVYTWAAQRVTISNVTFKNTPGQNFICQQGVGDTMTIDTCVFQNGGTSIPSNTNQVDYSAGYFTGTNVTIRNCHVFNDVQPFTYSGGFELHNSSQTVTGCTIEQSWPAVYIGPDTLSGVTRQSNVTITNNTMNQCGRGVIFNATAPPTDTVNGAIDTVTITGNTINLKSFPPLGGTRGIDQDTPGDGATWTYHHIITNLNVSNNDVTDTDGTTDYGMAFSQLQSGSVTGNRFHGISGRWLNLSSNPYGGFTNFSFNSNTGTWAASTGSPCIVISSGADTFSGVQIKSNTITVSPANNSSLAVYADGSAISNVVVSGNTFTGIGSAVGGPAASSLSYTP